MRHDSKARRLIWIAYCLLAGVPFAWAQGYSTTVPATATLPDPDSCYTTITTAVTNQTVLSAIHIKTAADVASIRSALIAQIWGTSTLPTRIAQAVATTANPSPGNVATNASGLYASLSSASPSYLGTEYRLTVNLLASPAVNSIVYEWTPKVGNGRLFIVHDGHSDNSYNPDGSVWLKAINDLPNQATVSALLQLGYTVLWVQMPLYGDNLTSLTASVQQIFPIDPINPDDPDNPAATCQYNTTTNPSTQINITNSSCARHLGIFLNSATLGNPWRYFIEPVVVAINTALSQGSFRDITMMGASGEGGRPCSPPLLIRASPTVLRLPGHCRSFFQAPPMRRRAR